MRFLFLTFSLLMLCFTAFGQEKKDGYVKFYHESGEVSSEGYMKDGEPDGFWRSYYINGQLKSEGNRKNGRLDSVWVFYNVYGDTLSKINYFNGMKNGYYYKYKEYKNKEGTYLSSKELYKNNVKEGISYYYYEGGILHKSIYFEEGLKNGEGKEYDKNGNLIGIYEYRNNMLTNFLEINRYDKNGLKQGIWRSYYPNGKIESETTYKDGLINGYVKKYSLTSELVEAIRYEDGIMMDSNYVDENTAEFENEYYEDGSLKSSGAYIGGKPVGVHREYDELGRVNRSRMYDTEGNLIGEGIVNVDGNKQGDWKFYYASGELKATGQYRENYENGNWVYYYKSGNIEQKGKYKRGDFHGDWTWYFPDKDIRREESYFNGREDGYFIEYDEYGEVIARGEYIDGYKNGKWYYKEGDIIRQGAYKDDLMDGEWVFYYSSGEVFFRGNFIQGNPDGKHRYYYKNKKLKKDTFYSMGRKEKTWRIYNRDGTLDYSLSYENDKLIRINGVSVDFETSIEF